MNPNQLTYYQNELTRIEERLDRELEAIRTETRKIAVDLLQDMRETVALIPSESELAYIIACELNGHLSPAADSINSVIERG